MHVPGVLKDTTLLPLGGAMVIRFITDNPGVWLAHCHIDIHLESGLYSPPSNIAAHFQVPDYRLFLVYYVIPETSIFPVQQFFASPESDGMGGGWSTVLIF